MDVRSTSSYNNFRKLDSGTNFADKHLKLRSKLQEVAAKNQGNFASPSNIEEYKPPEHPREIKAPKVKSHTRGHNIHHNKALSIKNGHSMAIPVDKRLKNNKNSSLDLQLQELPKRPLEPAALARQISEDREAMNQEARDKMAEKMQDFISSIDTDLSFRLDEESGRNVVTIYEASSGDIIRQVPEEEMLEVLRRLRKDTAKYKSGLVFDDKI